MPNDDKDSRSMFHVRTHTQSHAYKKWPNKSHKSPDNAATHTHTHTHMDTVAQYNKNTSQCNGNCMSQTNEMATAQTWHALPLPLAPGYAHNCYSTWHGIDMRIIDCIRTFACHASNAFECRVVQCPFISFLIKLWQRLKQKSGEVAKVGVAMSATCQ